jgi:hypothetical protein
MCDYLSPSPTSGGYYDAIISYQLGDETLNCLYSAKNISYLKMSFFLKKKKTHYVILGRQYLLKNPIIYEYLHISSSIMICVSCDNYEWVSKKVNFQHN